MRLAIPLCILAALAGCSGELVSGSLGPSGLGIGHGTGGGGGTGVAPAALHGSWLRTVTFYGTDGSLHVSETRWDFESTGAAVRVVTTTNVTYGTSDVSIATARWRVEGGLLVVDFLTPVAGTVRFAFDVRELTGGTQLTLGDQVFQRVPR